MVRETSCLTGVGRRKAPLLMGFGFRELFRIDLDEVQTLRQNLNIDQAFCEEQVRIMLTADDFFLPDAHLIVNQAMFFHTVTQSDQLITHALQKSDGKKVLWKPGRSIYLQHFLTHVFLALEDCQPASVKFVPKLDSFCM